MLHFDVKEILSFISKPPADRSPALLPLKGLAGSSVYFPLLSLGKQSPPKIHVVIKENSTEATYAAADLSVLLGIIKFSYFRLPTEVPEKQPDPTPLFMYNVP